MKKIILSLLFLILVSPIYGSIVTDGTIRIGSDTTFETSFKREGDLYSDDGSMYMGAGYNGRASKYGAGLQLREFDAAAAILYLAIEATFTAATATIEKAGQTFITDGVVTGNYITLTGASDGTFCDIRKSNYIC